MSESKTVDRKRYVVDAFFAECEAVNDELDGVSVLTLSAFERAVEDVRDSAFSEGAELGGQAQANLVRMANAERRRADVFSEAFNLISPFVAKFAEAARHYDGGRPRFEGSVFTHDADPAYEPALTGTATGVGGPGAPASPSIGDLRLLAEAYVSAIALLATPTTETRA